MGASDDAGIGSRSSSRVSLQQPSYTNVDYCSLRELHDVVLRLAISSGSDANAKRLRSLAFGSLSVSLIELSVFVAHQVIRETSKT